MYVAIDVKRERDEQANGMMAGSGSKNVAGV